MSRVSALGPARREWLASSLWLVPTIFAVGAVVAAALAIVADEHLHWRPTGTRFLGTDADTAITLATIVATGMLVFLGIVFSTTLVAIQLAASQYSPRAVRVFVRSRFTKVCLGIFVATLVFAVATLLQIHAYGRTRRGDPPVLSVAIISLLLFATLIAFLVFAHNTSRLLRVQYLIERIARDTSAAMHDAFPPASAYTSMTVPDPASAPSEILAAERAGVLSAIDVARAAAIAARCGGWIEIAVPVGTYVGPSMTIAYMHGTESPTPAELHRCLLLRNERTMLQDPGCGIRQLVDIAIRSLSPAVNDPTTAVQVVDRLTDVMARAAAMPDPTGWYVADRGDARVRMRADGFDELMTLAFNEIVLYGAGAPQVVRRLHATFDHLERVGGAARARVVSELRELLQRAVAIELPEPFAASAAPADARGLG